MLHYRSIAPHLYLHQSEAMEPGETKARIPPLALQSAMNKTGWKMTSQEVARLHPTPRFSLLNLGPPGEALGLQTLLHKAEVNLPS